MSFASETYKNTAYITLCKFYEVQGLTEKREENLRYLECCGLTNVSWDTTLLPERIQIFQKSVNTVIVTLVINMSRST